jgi:hypothetical protein
MKKYLFPLIITLSALSVSLSAAFYSVTGLSMLFAGASFAVLIMASSLEVAKLVIASLLYQYWNTLNKILRTYLTIATCILILITSAGIYGFLSAAYQTTATKSEIVDKQIASLETKKQLYTDSRNNILKEKQSLSDLRGTLSKGSTTQYTDTNGNLVVRTNNAAIRNIESTSKSDEKLSEKVDVVNDSIFSLENQILEIKTNSETTSELGPLKYISNLTDQPMDKIINWFLLIIIFVFDPLAISLVIAANFAFAQIKPKKLPSIKEEDNEIVKQPKTEKKNKESNQPLGFPIMIDPKTGKFFYEEPDPKDKNLDLDGDGVVKEEEIKEVFDQIDTNNDGVIDENEAKQSNLDKKTTNKLNQLHKSLSSLEEINNKNNYDFQWKKDSIKEEIANIKKIIINQFNEKDDDNTITYF